MTITYETRLAIASLPGKTVQPWRDGDTSGFQCSQCDLCGVLYRTEDIGKHEAECQAALVAALERSRVVGELDAWARKQRGPGHETMQIAGGLFITRLLDAFSLSPTTEDFEGAEPGDARAAAAKWLAKDSSSPPGAPVAAVDSGAETPREATGTVFAATDSPGGGAGSDRFIVYLRDDNDEDHMVWSSGIGFAEEAEAFTSVARIEKNHEPGFATAYRVERLNVVESGEWIAIECKGKAEEEDSL